MSQQVDHIINKVHETTLACVPKGNYLNSDEGQEVNFLIKNLVEWCVFLFILYHEFPHVMPSHPQLITFQVNKSRQLAVIKVEWNQVKVPLGKGNFPCRIINKDVFVVIFCEWISHLEHFFMLHFYMVQISCDTFSISDVFFPAAFTSTSSNILFWFFCECGWVVMVVYIHGEIRDERKNKK